MVRLGVLVRVWPVLICDHGDGVEAVLVSVILCSVIYQLSLPSGWTMSWTTLTDTHVQVILSLDFSYRRFN